MFHLARTVLLARENKYKQKNVATAGPNAKTMEELNMTGECLLVRMVITLL